MLQVIAVSDPQMNTVPDDMRFSTTEEVERWLNHSVSAQTFYMFDDDKTLWRIDSGLFEGKDDNVRSYWIYREAGPERWQYMYWAGWHVDR